MGKNNIYVGMDKQLNSMPRVKPVATPIGAIERDFENWVERFKGENWKSITKSKRPEEILKVYDSKFFSYFNRYFGQFREMKNRCEWRRLCADFMAAGVGLTKEYWTLTEYTLKAYKNGKDKGDLYCARVYETWDEMRYLSMKTDIDSFTRMKHLAYDEQLVPAMILLGCMYLRIGLTKKAKEVHKFMIKDIHLYCGYLDMQIKRCRKLRRDKCIIFYGSIAYLFIALALVLSWKVYATISVWKFILRFVVVSVIYLTVMADRNKYAGIAATALLTFVGAFGGGGGDTKPVVYYYGWNPLVWEFMLASKFNGY